MDREAPRGVDASIGLCLMEGFWRANFEPQPAAAAVVPMSGEYGYMAQDEYGNPLYVRVIERAPPRSPSGFKVD